MARSKKRKKLLRYRPRKPSVLNYRPSNLYMTVYAYICDNVPFIKYSQVVTFFITEHDYSRQRIYQILGKLVKRGYLIRGLDGVIALTKQAPIQFDEDDYGDDF